jgi:hypothetical protein
VIPIPTPIYHITHIKNLNAILKHDGLFAHSTIQKRNIIFANIAHHSIQTRRTNVSVPYHPFGNLHDYVPFYFAPRSPMLYTIGRGNVEGYNEGQGQIIYLKSNVQTIVQSGSSYVFTDGHGIMYYSEFYKDVKDMDKIDWDIMKTDYWADTPEDPDRKRRRQAEFLVHGFVPWPLFTEIGVMDSRMSSRVQNELAAVGLSTPIYVRRSWYY